jgi:hypothetical protein
VTPGRCGVDLIASRGKPSSHNEVVLQQDVRAADGEQDRRKATEIPEEGRDVRNGAVFYLADVRLDEVLVRAPSASTISSTAGGSTGAGAAALARTSCNWPSVLGPRPAGREL